MWINTKSDLRFPILQGNIWQKKNIFFFFFTGYLFMVWLENETPKCPINRAHFVSRKKPNIYLTTMNGMNWMDQHNGTDKTIGSTTQVSRTCEQFIIWLVTVTSTMSSSPMRTVGGRSKLMVHGMVFVDSSSGRELLILPLGSTVTSRSTGWCSDPSSFQATAGTAMFISFHVKSLGS